MENDVLQVTQCIKYLGSMLEQKASLDEKLITNANDIYKALYNTWSVKMKEAKGIRLK